MSQTYQRALGSLVLGVSIIVMGCKGKSPESSPQPPAPAPGDVHQPTGEATGTKGLFDQHCAKCHAITESAGAGGAKGMKKKGPNLARVGADAAHTVEWLAEHIKDAKEHKPNSRMPSFAGKLSDGQIQSLAEFLSSMK